jgi:dTDP-4-amino-4,6-dideoxygalactose transaminase
MKIYEKYKSKTEQYKNSVLLSQRIITLPSSINLKSEEIKYISSKVLEFLENS